MIIYNVTIKVDAAVAEPWLQWMCYEHIPEVMNTGCFIKKRVLRLLELDDAEGPTYTIQYTAATKESYDYYINAHAPQMRQQALDMWGDRFVAFRSAMEVVE